jgi:hypothetical protein
MDTIKVWLTGLTTIAVVATVFTSPYSGPIFTSIFGGMSNVYKSVRK